MRPRVLGALRLYASDYTAYSNRKPSDSRSRRLVLALPLLAVNPALQAILILRLANSGRRPFRRFWRALLRNQYAIDWDGPLEIGPRFEVPHPMGLTLAAGARLGTGVGLSHCVSLLAAPDGGVPEIGDDVIVNSGTIVIGSVAVGSGTHVGANCVVAVDVKPGQLVTPRGTIPRKAYRGWEPQAYTPPPSKGMRDALALFRSDVDADCRRRGVARRGGPALIWQVLRTRSLHGVLLLRVANASPRATWWLWRNLFVRVQHMDWSGPLEIGPEFELPQPFGVGLLLGSRIGAGVRVEHRVTLGGDPTEGRPTIGDRVTLGPGVLTVGGVTIGEDTVVEPNCVVTRDVAAHRRVTTRGVTPLQTEEPSLTR